MDKATEKTVRAIFQTAERNRAASEKLAGDTELIGPRITLVALAIELYLKALLAAHKTGHGGFHEHDKLFERLPASTRAQIRARYDAEMLRPEVTVKIIALMIQMPAGVTVEFDLDRNLAHGSKAFVKWRYNYEGDLPALPTCYEICEALRQELISTAPDLPVIESTGDRFMVLMHRGQG